MSLNMIYTQHMEDLQTYLTGKLPEVPQHIMQEIAAHISNRTAILVSDMLMEAERDRRYRDRIRAEAFKKARE